MDRALLGMKGSVVGTAAICVLLSLLSIVGYSGLLDARSVSGQPLPEIPASTSIAGTPPSLAAAAGPVATGSTRDDSHAAADLSTYLFFHQTWHRATSTPITPGSSTCPERP
ncbi:MAG TPA: hypothetical protein VFC14_00670 [Burkholderiales bacterium]|nr:hypothetical protein [Burkholderiales bacterium]